MYHALVVLKLLQFQLFHWLFHELHRLIWLAHTWLEVTQWFYLVGRIWLHDILLLLFIVLNKHYLTDTLSLYFFFILDLLQDKVYMVLLQTTANKIERILL
jgi:hypothetical protein